MTARPATVQPARSEIAVPPPVGRELLRWEEKRTPQSVPVPALQICEEFTGDTARQRAAQNGAAPIRAHSALDDSARDDSGLDDSGPFNRLYHADNRDALAHLLAEGWAERIRLIYIDPPFDSGLAYARKVRTRGPQRRALGEAVQYRDIWPGDAYLQFMYERLLLMRPLLAANGVLWLHCDYRQAHRLQLILEEVFGAENYLNTIAWRSQVARGAKVNAFYFPNSTHFIHVFAKDRRADPIWHPPRKRIVYTRRQAAAQYMQDERGFFRTSDPGTYSFGRLKELHSQGRLYAPYNGEICIDDATKTVYCTNGGNIGVKYYLQAEGKNRFSVERAVDNLWDDIPGLGTTPGEDVGYPTQKTEALLERIIATATDPGDWVLDCFAGSGTTPTVAQRMNRRWIACDLGFGSIQSTRRRLYALSLTAGPDATSHDSPRETDAPPTEATKVTASARFVLYANGADNPFAWHKPPAATTNAIDDAPNGTSHAGNTRPDTPQPRRLTVQVQAMQTQDVQVRIQPASTEHTDWRTWIDTVEIDPAYNGVVFRPRLVDAPVNRRELIAGTYTLSRAIAGNTLAARMTQVTGDEEILVIKLNQIDCSD